MIDFVYIYILIKKPDKILTHFGDALSKKYNLFFIDLFIIARGVQLDNGVHPWEATMPQ